MVLFDAQRHTYAGLRMPWPIPSDRAWMIVHRLAALAFAGSAIGLLALAWFDLGAGYLVIGFACAVTIPTALAGLASLMLRRF